jgi:hypothetical protein
MGCRKYAGIGCAGTIVLGVAGAFWVASEVSNSDQSVSSKIGSGSVEVMDDLSNSALDAAEKVDWAEKTKKVVRTGKSIGEGVLEGVGLNDLSGSRLDESYTLTPQDQARIDSAMKAMEEQLGID